MSISTSCTERIDPLKLVHEGTSQKQRLFPALDPKYVPVNEHSIEHGIAFAQAYSEFLKYYDSTNSTNDGMNWKPFFSNDVSVQLAVATIQDVEYYKNKIKTCFDYLITTSNIVLNTSESSVEDDLKKEELKNNLSSLFNYVGTLARQLDLLKDKLPSEIPLKNSLQNQIQSRLAPLFGRLVAYYKAGKNNSLITNALSSFNIMILGNTTIDFSDIINNDKFSLSNDWKICNALDWKEYIEGISADNSVYGSDPNVFKKINHIATHNLFTSIFDQFLKIYARTVSEAKLALEKTLTDWNGHQPHYALFLAFLRLLEYARTEVNTLTGRHLDFYYREILRLKEKSSEPSHAYLLVELANQFQQHIIKAGELFKGGKDDLGHEVFFANDRDFVANQAKIASLKTIYRHGDEKIGTTVSANQNKGRLYASSVSNSDDGLGAELTSIDQSWHPFYNKIYQDGILSEIRMPEAEVGFAIASHYLWMSGGERIVTIKLTPHPFLKKQMISLEKKFSKTSLTKSTRSLLDLKDDIMCLFTSEKGWIEKKGEDLKFTLDPKSGDLELIIKISTADSAITSYLPKTHGYNFNTELPILLVKLKHQNNKPYIYSSLQDLEIQQINLTVNVQGLKTLAVSNDFGSIDTSKPFQPFGAQPVNGSSFIVGSKEVFQKTLKSASLKISWQNSVNSYSPQKFSSQLEAPKIRISYLEGGIWHNFSDKSVPFSDSVESTQSNYELGSNGVIESTNLSENEFYSIASRSGYVRLSLALEGDFGFKKYQEDLARFLVDKTLPSPTLPSGPIATEVSVDYAASQIISLNSSAKDHYEKRSALFFHIAPFGYAEQHPFLNAGKKIYLLPQFASEAKFYIGITALDPPQNLALLFQVVDGTADPLFLKIDTLIQWSYLSNNEWVSFKKNEIEDETDQLLNSGIITFSVPREASNSNTLLLSGMHWIRGAIASKSDAACRLRLVATQALRVTFINKNNDLAFPAKVLPAGTISKLDQPDAAIRKISQPFTTFGGKGFETSEDFYTRISERLRHKDRAIALWDYERLVLEAFPQIYKVKCLNHTCFESDKNGEHIYNELAAGHLTLLTIPNQQFYNLRDPLRPYTSLYLMDEINNFLRKHTSCFVKLHVKNPLFEEVRAAFNVRLYDGFDETFYRNKLNEEIIRFLSPWAFPGGDGPSFGGKIYKSVLIDFVEQRPYVDYVTDFKLFHKKSEALETGDQDEVEGSKAISIWFLPESILLKLLNPLRMNGSAKNVFVKRELII